MPQRRCVVACGNTHQVDARAVFDRFDADRNGRLDPGELARFFMAALPGVDDSQLRYLMAHMYE